MNNPLVIAWLLDAATLIASALLLACLAYGLTLLVIPDTAQRLAMKLNRRYSARKAMRPMEVPRNTERFFYRHHRLAGSLLLAGVAAFFLLYVLDFPRDTVLARLSNTLGTALAGALLESATWLLLGGNILVGVVALAMIVRPSLLKPVEAVANRWLSTRRALRAAEQEREPLDRFTARSPRLAGALILLGTLYVAIGLLVATG